jgi:hypothetical protein
MKKIMAWLMIALSVLVILGMIINSTLLWFVIDILVIVGCGLSGIFLLIEKT